MTQPLTAAGLPSAGHLTGQGDAMASVDLYWLPLGAGEPLGIVRRSGKVFEAIEAHHQHRAPCDLYHSALQIRLGDDAFVIEMAPVWGNKQTERGVVGERGRRPAMAGALAVLPLRGPPLAGRRDSRSGLRGRQPRHIPTDPGRTRRLLDLVPAFPTVTWGRDELGAREMWNSNSLTAWLLARSGHDTDGIAMPPYGRAPGWAAGLIIAARQQALDSERTQVGRDGAPA